MQELKRILNRKTIVIMVLILIVNVMAFIITQPKTVDEKWSKEKAKYIEEYSETTSKVLKNAQRMLKMSVFSDESGFANKNIIKTANDYKRIEGLELTMDKDSSTRAVLLYEYINPFVFAMIIYILYNMSRERKNGMMSITYATGHGRKKLALKRGVIIFVIAFTFTMLLYLTNLIIALIMYGIDDFNGPVQTIMEYSGYTYRHSKGMCILLAVLKNALLCASISLLAYVICNMFGHINVSLIIIGVILCGEWWLYKNISTSSNLEYLKYINIFAIFSYNNIERQYNNMFIFNECISASDGLFAFMMIILIISFVFAIAFYRKKETKIPKLIKKILEIYESTTQKILAILPFGFKELWKILFVNKGIIVIAIGIYLFFFVWNHTLITIPERLSEMDGIYREYGGSDWSEFLKYVEDYTAQKESYLVQIADIEEKMRTGELPPNNVFVVGRLKDQISYMNEVLKEFNAKIQMHNELIEERGINTYVISDRGFAEAIDYNSLLRENFYGIMFLVAMIIITSMTFELEHDSGILSLCAPSKRGRGWVFVYKCLVLTLFTVLCFVVLYVADFIKLTNNYNIMYYDAPIQSLTYMAERKEKISIAEYIGIMIALKLIYTLLVQALIIFVSSKKNVKNRSYIFIVALIAAIVYAFISKISITAWIVAMIVGAILYLIVMYTSYRRWRFNNGI